MAKSRATTAVLLIAFLAAVLGVIWVVGTALRVGEYLEQAERQQMEQCPIDPANAATVCGETPSCSDGEVLELREGTCVCVTTCADTF